jgi:2'-5' RNA ligase
LPLPEPHREQLAAHLADYAVRAPAFRWVAPANLHLTLRFVGWSDRERVHDIGQALATRSLVAVRLELGGLGAFKRGRLVRVVWVGLQSGAEETKALARLVDAECALVGLEAERRPFAPHLTLARARARDGAVLPELPPLPQLQPWTATELVLYRSHLGQAGVNYEPLLRVPLGSSG